MDSLIAGDEEAPPRPFNYFNYFTEVEEEFVKRRGKGLLISPLEWSLVEAWKNAGIPLHLVLRSINEAFDGYDKRPHRGRLVNTIFYCQQAVESNFVAYRLGRVGEMGEGGGADHQSTGEASPKSTQGSISKADLVQFIDRCSAGISRAASLVSDNAILIEALKRAGPRLGAIRSELEESEESDAEAIERDLDSIDRLIVDALKATTTESAMKELHQEAKSHLRPFKRKMEKSIYDQTVENFILRRLREINHIPRLSLFYM